MKHQYFGDINDYTKYGLLRCFADAGLRIGVCWMLTPNDGRPDGRKVQYLANSRQWRQYDPILFDILVSAVKRSRNLRYIENPQILPNTSFCKGFVPESTELRNKWFLRSLKKLDDVDLLFFDPDNGIEVASVPFGKRNSIKYLYWAEIDKAWEHSVSLIVFQHFPRQNREEYARKRAAQFSSRLPGATVVSFLTSNVLYLLAYRKGAGIRFKIALAHVEQRWSKQLKRIILTEPIG